MTAGERKVTDMNRYALIARDHWRVWLPHTVAEMANPEAFFTDLGLRVENQVDSRTAKLAGPDITGEGYLEKLGRLRMARFDAEASVLRELVLLPPEPGHPRADPESGTAMVPAGSPTLRQDSDGWWPLEITLGHPLWTEDDEIPSAAAVPQTHG